MKNIVQNTVKYLQERILNTEVSKCAPKCFILSTGQWERTWKFWTQGSIQLVSKCSAYPHTGCTPLL